MRSFRIRIFLGLFICLIPAVSAAAAALVARTWGCKLNEGLANPCVVMGRDIGEVLSQMGVMGWFMLATVPVAAVLVAIWIVAEIAALFRRRPS